MKTVAQIIALGLLVLFTANVANAVTCNAPVQWTSYGGEAYSELGSNLTTGDFNGDGVIDTATQSNIATFVWYGCLTSHPSGKNVNETADWFSTVVGELVTGDFDGDGFDDLCVLAEWSNPDPAEELEGAVFCWNGGPSGGLGAPGNPENADWKAESNIRQGIHQPFGGRRRILSSDINGDGVSDLIWGLPGGTAFPPAPVGQVHIWYGGKPGLCAPALSPSGLGPCGSANPANSDWMADGRGTPPFVPAIDSLGSSLVTGDFNADFQNDLCSGATQYDNPGAGVNENRGGVFCWYGEGGGLGPTGTWTNADWRSDSQQPGCSCNWGGSLTAGDFDSNGYDDLALGASLYNPQQLTNEGQVFVYPGSVTGITPNPDTPSNAAWNGRAQAADSQFGSALATGDANCDSHVDLVVGSMYYDNPVSNEGALFRYQGGEAGLCAPATSPSGLGLCGDPDSSDWCADSNSQEAKLGSAIIVSDFGGGVQTLAGAFTHSLSPFFEGKIILYEPDATCLGNVCRPVTGACCISGSCFDTVPSSTCAALGGLFTPSVDCTGTCPRVGACCDPSGACREESSEQCQDNNGTYQGDGFSCGNANCPQPPPGACCDPSTGGCSVMTAEDCASSQGGYQGNGTVCDPDTCTPLPQTGACCIDTFCNEDFTFWACEVFFGGNYQGNGSMCAPDMCAPRGACCNPSNGTCSNGLTETACTNNGGTYQGDWSDCAGISCPQPKGACCDPATGTCSEATANECSADGGNYQGDDTLCVNTTCPPPPPPTGACCNTGACSEVTETTCVDAGGTYQGNNTLCAATSCPPPTGACCNPSTGGCEVTDQATCSAAGGNYSGNDTDCTPNLCPQPGTGACCTNSGCLSGVTAAACTSQSGAYYGDGTLCPAGSTLDNRLRAVKGFSVDGWVVKLWVVNDLAPCTYTARRSIIKPPNWSVFFIGPPEDTAQSPALTLVTTDAFQPEPLDYYDVLR